MLRLHDTATGTVRPLAQRDPGRVSMYVCGPTVYEVPHLGHGRSTLVFDVLRRYLTFQGNVVRHVSNVTDVDDKIIAKAASEGTTEQEVAARFEASWWAAMDAIDVLRPTEVPHATGYVEGMVALVADLVRRAVAYETPDGVYLSVDLVPGYGLLARQPLDTLRAGARVEAVAGKRSPLDFALWKKAKPGEPSWPSPWGPGRPGWHTECVVMSLDLLGEGFDLHGGGQDLAFPHHENERAQALADDKVFARHWMHHGWVMVEGEKMSKSLGNFTTLAQLVSARDPRAYRLLVLRAHYRSPIEVTPATIADAEKGLDRLDRLARRLGLDDPSSGAPAPVPVPVRAVAVAQDPSLDAEAIDRFCERMDDDLDTPGALAGVFDLVSRAHSAADRADPQAAPLARTVALLAGAMGVRLHAPPDVVDDRTRELVAQRDAARVARQWVVADELRDRLVAEGWVVEDGPSGTVVHR